MSVHLTTFRTPFGIIAKLKTKLQSLKWSVSLNVFDAIQLGFELILIKTEKQAI